MVPSDADIEVRRVYDRDVRDGSGIAGRAFLVDGMWPRGVRKDELTIAGWLRDLAPSKGLREWFGHDPNRWEEFRERYFRELDAAPEALRPLVDALRQGPVTLLYAAKDTEHNNAVALRSYLVRSGGGNR